MSVEATVSPPARPSERLHHPVRALLLAGGPRFVRAAFGPMPAFYLGWRPLGFDAGMAAPPGLAPLGSAFLVSLFVGHPLAQLLATESYDFPPQVRASATFRQTCSRISLAWAGCLFLASAVRLLVLRLGSVDLYVVVNVLSGLPVSA